MANEIWMYIIIGIIALIFLGIIISWIITRMKGKIDLELEKYQFSTGEKINGKIKVRLKKPVEAKMLKVGIIGMQKQTGRKQASEISHEVFYEFSMPVKGAGIFPAGETSYNFSLKIPDNLFTRAGLPSGAEQVINTGLRVLSALGKVNMSSVKWYVSAELDVSGLNMKKQVQVQIG